LISVKSKNDYLKTGERENIHVTIRKDINEDLSVFCLRLRESKGKVLDMMIKLILEDEKLTNELKNKIRTYR
jgi:hypothetical protein